MKSKFNKSSGQVARLFLVLAIVVLVAVIIVYLVMQMAQKPAAPAAKPVTTIPQPVYEKQIDNVDFIFESALDRGNVLRASEVTNPTQYNSSYQKDLATTEKFIEVTIGAQNKSTQNMQQGSWDIGNIVDSAGRNFVPDDKSVVGAWLPANDACGDLLKPAFEPAPCTKIYEVSRQSTGLKITVETGKGNSANSLSSGSFDSALIDLIVK